MKFDKSRWSIETIIDPLYAPIRFKIYDKPQGFRLLSSEAHLPHGFSPYILLDFVRLEKAIGALLGNAPGRVEASYLAGLSADTRGMVREYMKARKAGDGRSQLDRLRRGILANHREYVARSHRLLEDLVQPGGRFDPKRLDSISQYFLPAYAFEVECPVSGPAEIASCYMTEEGKIYEVIRCLMRSFEVRRCHWLQQAGGLSSVHRAATHSRLAHMVGCVIVAFRALSDVSVLPSDDLSMSLGQYLLLRGKLQEFIAASFLHDLGHPPLSHTLELNPFLKPKLDHEDITRSLISSGRGKDNVNWHYLTFFLMKLQTELRTSTPGFGIADGAAKPNQEAVGQGCDVVTAHGTLVNCGLNTILVREILGGVSRKAASSDTGSDGPMPDSRSAIHCVGNAEIASERIPEPAEADGRETDGELDSEILHSRDVAFLRTLVESDIDLDRVDHIRRDSAVCGLSLTSFRLREMLQGISIALPGSSAFNAAEDPEATDPEFRLLLGKHAAMYALDLLSSRRWIYETVLHSPENCFINGVINQMVACAALMLPHLVNQLPFITDQILSHFLANKQFVDTQVEKLGRLLQGKADSASYEQIACWQLQEPYRGTELERLREQYQAVRRFNDEHVEPSGLLPACVFFSNARVTQKTEKDAYEEARWDSRLYLHKVFSDGRMHRLRDLTETCSAGKGAAAPSPPSAFPAKPEPERTKGLIYMWLCRSIPSRRANGELLPHILELQEKLLLTLPGAQVVAEEVGEHSSLEKKVEALKRSLVHDLERPPVACRTGESGAGV